MVLPLPGMPAMARRVRWEGAAEVWRSVEGGVKVVRREAVGDDLMGGRMGWLVWYLRRGKGEKVGR